MRNPNRTTKPERRAVRASNPMVCRAMGTAATARLQRKRNMRPEAEQLDRLTRALGLETLITESSHPIQPSDDQAYADAVRRNAEAVAAALTERVLRPELERMGIDSSRYTYGLVDEDKRLPQYTESIGYEVGPGPNPHMTLKYPPHISLGESQAYRAGLDLGPEYVAWDGAPWRDPTEVDAIKAAADAAAPDFREWWCAPEPEQPHAIGTEHLHKVVDEFQRNVLPDLIARPDDDNEES